MQFDKYHLAYYGGVAALAIMGLVEWPIAVIVAAGHVLATQHKSPMLRDAGEAIELVEE